MPEITGIAEAWIEATLTADAPLMALLPGGLWNEKAEQGTSGTIAIYRLISGIRVDASDTLKTLNSLRVWTRLRYLIVVIGTNGRHEDLREAALAIETLLDRKSGTVTGGEIKTCLWEGPYKTEYDNGGDQHYQELGAFWEIRARAA